MIDVKKFINELKKWQISYYADENMRICLIGGDKRARMYYSRLVMQYPELENNLLLELAETDKVLMTKLEEENAAYEGPLSPPVPCLYIPRRPACRCA